MLITAVTSITTDVVLAKVDVTDIIPCMKLSAISLKMESLSLLTWDNAKDKKAVVVPVEVQA